MATAVAITALGSACAPARSSVFDPVPRVSDLPPLLTWLGEFTRPSGTVYPNFAHSERFGGISGITFDNQTGEWVGVIDDRDESRLVWVSVTMTADGLQVSPTHMSTLRSGHGIFERVAAHADLEAITALPDGTFLVSEEGHTTKEGGVWQPALLRVTRDGVVTDVFEYPKEFRITGDGKTGVRENQGFESLTRTPSGRVITGLEQPLMQNGVTSFDRSGEGVLIELEPRRRSWRVSRQWRYEIDATPTIDGFTELCSDGENGLVDLLATSDTTLISMERACLRDPKGNRVANSVRLFAVELIGLEAKKTLLLTLSDLSLKLSSALAGLENFEALSFGPPIGGQRTLMIVSDDNFRKTQRTSFLLFGLRY